MNLDDKLKEIYRRSDVSNNRTDNPIGEDDFIATTKQAFIDEGYYTLRELKDVRYKFMTGQEFYDRVAKEVSSLSPERDEFWAEAVLEIVKKAAGLS